MGAISQASSNVWMGWPFVLALFVAATAIILMIDVDAAKRELADYVDDNTVTSPCIK